MTQIIFWAIAIPTFGVIGGLLHTHRMGPLRLLTRGLMYVRAAGETALESFAAFEFTWRTQFDKHLANVRREW